MANSNPVVLTNDEFKIVKAIQAGTSRAHIIKKYKITSSRYDDLSNWEVANNVDLDNAISKLSSNQSLIDAAAKLDVPFIEELHGLARLDQKMQQTGIKIMDKLLEQVEEADGPIQLQIIVQTFVLMRKSMFSTGPETVHNNFTSMSSVTNNRA